MHPEDPIEPAALDRSVPRLHVSAVAPQRERVATRCPLRVQFDALPPAGVEPLPMPVGAQLRADEAMAFAAEVFEELRSHHLDSITIDDDLHPDDAQDLTHHAMDVGVPLIISGWLPVDLVGRRSGRPSLLVRAERRPDGRWAYHPIDVKRHLTLGPEPTGAEVPTALVSSLERLALLGAERHPQRTARTRTDDLLQLAHHHRILEAIGRSSADAVGGVVGVERQVIWHRLDEGALSQRRDGSVASSEAPLARYEAEFAHRL